MLWFRNLTPIDTGDLYILEIGMMVKTKENFLPVIFTSEQVNHISGTKTMKEVFSCAPFSGPAGGISQGQCLSLRGWHTQDSS